jgi:type IV pilus assembly protein PilN
MRINLLPWREATRIERKRAFAGFLILAALMGMVIVLAVMICTSKLLDNQLNRNVLLREENALLDIRIKEIAGLNEDIKALKARQSAVINLQARRNHSVYMFDELATHVPNGIILKSIKQSDSIILIGYAQSNARVSEFLRNLGTQTQWLTRPELVEIKSVVYGQGKETRKLFEFTLKVDLINLPVERS